MGLLYVLLVLIISLQLIIILISAFKKNDLSNDFAKIDNLIRNEFSINRNEYQNNFKQFDTTVRNEFLNNRNEVQNGLKQNREEIFNVLKNFEQSLGNNFNNFIMKEDNLRKEIIENLEKIRETVEKRLEILQNENSKKIDEMRQTVDEKLQNALEKKLTESFKQVSERLEQVYKGLGEMQTLAQDVGGLKKVISNVKTKGIFGEVQLEAIINEILTKDQFVKNFSTKRGSKETVEFAIKLPSRDLDSDQITYLPIDSKFPTESYYKLADAYDSGDKNLIQQEIKNLASNIEKFAKDIKDKYIDPPNTSDFAIMFLPFESLYAEVIKNTSLVEKIFRDYRIIITGPTTLSAFLNSLRMGFTTLALQKGANKVWEVLATFKKEFETFTGVFEKARKKITEAGNELDDLVGTRMKKIENTLKKVENMPAKETINLLEINN